MKNLKQKLIIFTILMITLITIIKPNVYGMFQADMQFSHRTDFFLTYNRS